MCSSCAQNPDLSPGDCIRLWIWLAVAFPNSEDVEGRELMRATGRAKWIVSLMICCMNVGFDWQDSESVLCWRENERWKCFELGRNRKRGGRMGVPIWDCNVLSWGREGRGGGRGGDFRRTIDRHREMHAILTTADCLNRWDWNLNVTLWKSEAFFHDTHPC